MKRVLTAYRIVRETLREIFDENAYARYLARTGMSNSRASYEGFLRENECARARRPRCC